jgi:hypothetical protein
MVAEVGEMLAVNEGAMEKLYMEKFNLKKPKEENKEQYQVKISDRFAV